MRAPKVLRATTVAKSSTMAICDFRGSHLATSRCWTSQPNWIGTSPFRKRTPPIHGFSGDPGLPSGKLPSVKITKSEDLGLESEIGLGGPCSMSHFHCLRASTIAWLRWDWFSFVYCLSDRARRKARPIFPQSWDDPNINFPRSLPAWPGGKTCEDKMDEISSKSSIFLDCLILSSMLTKPYVTPKIVGSLHSCNFFWSNWAPSHQWTFRAISKAEEQVAAGSNPYLSS